MTIYQVRKWANRANRRGMQAINELNRLKTAGYKPRLAGKARENWVLRCDMIVQRAQNVLKGAYAYCKQHRALPDSTPHRCSLPHKQQRALRAEFGDFEHGPLESVA